MINADSMKLSEVINNVAADLLSGTDPTIPKEEVDRCAHAFEIAKEMVIEGIKQREFDDMTGGKIGRIVHNYDRLVRTVEIG
jgi:hypothetical protein